MTAVRAQLDPRTVRSSRRTAPRRKLHLPAEGVTDSGTSDVLILNISTTGLLLETLGDLSEGETIELDIPEAVGVRAVVKWSSGQLFGCKFLERISIGAVSAALLRSSYEPPISSEVFAPPEIGHLDDNLAEESSHQGELSFNAKMRWITGLALLSWIVVIAAASLVWTYFR